MTVATLDAPPTASSSAAAAGSAGGGHQQQQQQQQQHQQQQQPRIRWDLSIDPPALNRSFWAEQAAKYTRRDVQVAYFFLVLIILLTIKHVQHTGWLQTLQTFAPAWFTQIVWMSALRAPSFWETNRLPLLLLIKLKIALQTVHANNSIIDLLYVDKGLAPLAPPTATLLYKTVLVTGVAHFPAMSVCMRLPFLLQLGYLMFLGTSLFLSASPREMVTVTHVLDQVHMLDTSTAVYARLVQSGAPVLMRPDSALQDRSASMTVTLLTIYLSTVVVTLYLAYVGQWIELRGWLRDKAALVVARQFVAGRHQRGADIAMSREPAPAPSPPPPAAPLPPSSTPLPPKVEINGVEVTQQQLLNMVRSPWAALLLDGQGLLGQASMFCLHASAIHVCLIGSLLTSQLLVLRVAPRVLPAPILHMYYPLIAPPRGGAGDVCQPGDEPQFVGWLGKLLLMLSL